MLETTPVCKGWESSYSLQIRKGRLDGVVENEKGGWGAAFCCLIFFSEQNKYNGEKELRDSTWPLRFNMKDTHCLSQDCQRSLILAAPTDLVMSRVVGDLEGREPLIPQSGVGDLGVAEEAFFFFSP